MPFYMYVNFMPIYIYTKFHAVLHMSRFMIYMFTKLCSIYIDQVLYPKLHVYHVYTNLFITSSNQITYIKIHVKLYMPIPILAITIIMTIPKYQVFMLMVNYPQTSNFHIMPSIPPNTYIPLGNIPIFPPYTIARIS